MMTRAGENGPRLDSLAKHQRAEDDRDDRVDVGVGGDEWQRGDAEHPAVDGERQDAADHRQVDERDE